MAFSHKVAFWLEICYEMPVLSAWGRAMSDVAYYLRREQEERALAAAAQSPDIRAIHETLAQKYAELAVRGLPPAAASSNQQLSAKA